MNWLIYGDILESHVVQSFLSELINHGQKVHMLSSLERSHVIFPKEKEQAVLDRIVRFIDNKEIDVLFNFRASELTPSIIEYLKNRKIKTIVWFPDDPLLYEICYKYVAQFYDYTLHCGDIDVLSYYEEKLDVKGFSFPFWTGVDSFPYTYNPDEADIDIGFLGNCFGAQRKGRYALLASLPYKSLIYGRLAENQEDYANIHGGYIEDESQIANKIKRFKIGLNMAQSFSNLENERFYYPDLHHFTEFFFPSRIIQYASCGIPIVNKSVLKNKILPSIINISTRSELIETAGDLLQSTDKLKSLSGLVRRDFESYLTAKKRVEMLLNLLNEDVEQFTVEQRAEYWRAAGRVEGMENSDIEYSENIIDLDKLCDPLEVQREKLLSNHFSVKEHYRILHIGRNTFGDTDIVNRMKSSLENLGHIVFDINSDEFRQILHNPQGLKGGYGPIELKLDLLRPVLQRFRPQIIMCNANGFTFSEEDSEWIKENGYILVGINLSDPDVFITAKTYANRFDYLLTNSYEALNMYHDIGIKNVVYFPFAIDSRFINAYSDERPDWRADVVCIGNATKRPERNEFMKELAKYFKVRVYGNDWDFEKSFSVRGGDTFSAARAGKFHINFPKTYAGYTNVKIGIFESIANGGILCTGYFDEMKRFFEYDKEIIGYNDIADLRAKIEYLLENPYEIELIRRRAFERLTKDHTWESRWETLFKIIREDLHEKRQLLPEERYSQIELKGCAEKAKRIIVQGFYGAKNTGDDLILETIYRKIIERYPEALIMVSGFNRENITFLMGMYSLPRTDIFRMEKIIRDCDLFILGGGGLLNDYSFNKSGGIADFFDNYDRSITGLGVAPTISRIHGKPVMFFALGVGPLDNPDARSLVRFLCNQADKITVRDAISQKILSSVCDKEKNIICTSDPVFLLPQPEVELGETYLREKGIGENEFVIAVSLRRWEKSPESFENVIALYLDKVIEVLDAKILFMPFQFVDGQGNDNNIHNSVQKKMKSKEKAFIYEHSGNYAELLSILSNVDLGICMRLHASIILNKYGIPAIGLNYDDKVKAHYETIGMVEYLLDMNFNIDEAISKAKYLKENLAEFRRRILSMTKNLETLAAENFTAVFDLLKKQSNHQNQIFYYPRNKSIKEGKPKKIEMQTEKNSAVVAKDRRENRVYSDIEYLDLKSAKIESENMESKDFILDIPDSERSDRLGIRLSNVNSPQKGDYSKILLEIPVQTDNEYELSFNIHSPYERPKNKGRIEYQIYIDKKQVYKEDIALSGKPKDFSVFNTSHKDTLVLELRLMALRNCENWGWGNATRIFLSNVCICYKEKNKSKAECANRPIKIDLIHKWYKKINLMKYN